MVATSPVSNQPSSSNASCAFAAEIAFRDGGPAHLQPAERLAVARQLLVVVVDDLHLDAEDRMTLLALVVELLFARQLGDVVLERAHACRAGSFPSCPRHG